MIAVFYITAHGFGHATRTLTLIEQLLAERRDLQIVVRSSVPEWFLRRSGPPDLAIQSVTADTGMVQIDSLRINIEATAQRAADFYQTFAARVAAEAAALTRLGASVVVGDIPPLAFAAAHAAGVPSVAVANFTWDWIYQAYPQFAASAPGVVDTMQAGYAQASQALRLPFAGGFESMRDVTTDIPLIARHSRLGRDESRRRLRIPSDRPVVLASFGGHTTHVPYDVVADRCDITLVLTERESPDEAPHTKIRRFGFAELDHVGIRYEDLVAAADIVVSKPGYGIVSECIANKTALLYTSRGYFVENEVMVEAMQQVMRCRFIAQDALREGDWQPGIDALLAQGPPIAEMRSDGADVAARAVLSLAQPRS